MMEGMNGNVGKPKCAGTCDCRALVVLYGNKLAIRDGAHLNDTYGLSPEVKHCRAAQKPKRGLEYTVLNYKEARHLFEKPPVRPILYKVYTLALLFNGPVER
jgi:hypothetical protein